MSTEKIEPAPEKEERSYFESRIYDEMGLTPEQNKIRLWADFGDNEHGGSSDYDIFYEDKNGNIAIRVYSVTGNLVQYEDAAHTGTTARLAGIMRMKEYIVTRINPKNQQDGDPKYRFPKGQGVFPFFPPALVKKYHARTEIPTLILTEGYIKAMTASLHGFDIIGLGSITHYADSNTRELLPDIKRVINDCKVQKVVLLYDGDCTNISEKDLEAGRDLARRPKGFYNAIINTRDLLLDFKVEIDFAYVRSDRLVDKPKGIDDLLNSKYYVNQRAEILKDLTENSNNGAYFFRMNVRDQQKRLQRQFYLDSVQSFYKHWKEKIGDKPFTFERMVYVYNPADDKVDHQTPEDIKNFVRVGDNYYEMIRKPNVRTDGYEDTLVPRQKGTIIDDFGRKSLKLIKKFKAFVNKPSHVDYKPIIDNCLNQYHRLNYHEEPNVDFPHIRHMMEHLFEEQIELGYDYMQLLYLHPLQILPILCFVSRERHTGKSTFLDFLRMLFGLNVAVVDNTVMTSQFNAFVSGKLLVCVDETALGDNQKITEYVKMMSTAKKATMQKKGIDHEEVENFTKYVLCANDETRFIYMQNEEIRFWVRKVKPLPKEEILGNMLEIFHDEIPGFLSFLIQRKMHIEHDQHSRMWFSPDDIHTEALDKLREAQLPKPVKAIKEGIGQLFIDFPQKEYILSVKTVKFLCPEVRNTNSDTLRTLLHDYLGVTPAIDASGVSPSRYIKTPYYEGNEVKYFVDKAKGFVFDPERILKPHEWGYLQSVLAATEGDATDAQPSSQK